MFAWAFSRLAVVPIHHRIPLLSVFGNRLADSQRLISKGKHHALRARCPGAREAKLGKLGAGHLSRVFRSCLAKPRSRQPVYGLQCEKGKSEPTSHRLTAKATRAPVSCPQIAGASRRRVHGHRGILNWAEPGLLETDGRGGAYAQGSLPQCLPRLKLAAFHAGSGFPFLLANQEYSSPVLALAGETCLVVSDGCRYRYWGDPGLAIWSVTVPWGSVFCVPDSCHGLI